jgi:hypothetical protein
VRSRRGVAAQKTRLAAFLVDPSVTYILFWVR